MRETDEMGAAGTNRAEADLWLTVAGGARESAAPATGLPDEVRRPPASRYTGLAWACQILTGGVATR